MPTINATDSTKLARQELEFPVQLSDLKAYFASTGGNIQPPSPPNVNLPSFPPYAPIADTDIIFLIMPDASRRPYLMAVLKAYINAQAPVTDLIGTQIPGFQVPPALTGNELITTAQGYSASITAIRTALSF